MTDSIHSSIDAISRRFFESIMYLVFLMIIIVLPVSLWRVRYTGFLPAHFLQILLGVIFSVLFFLRKRVPLTVLKISTTLLFFLLSVIGFWQWGLLGGGVYFMMGTLYMISATQGMKFSLISAFGLLLTGILFASLWIRGVLQFPIDVEVYLKQPQSWATTLMASISVSALFFVATTQLLRRLTLLSQQVAEQNERLEQMANYDILTGLPTLRFMEDRVFTALRQAEDSHHSIGLMFLDLDNFKQVNDSYGHDAGDKVLRITSERILSLLSDADTVSRLGGDEFLILLGHMENPETEISEIAGRLLERVSEAIVYGENHICITVSIGCSYFPEHGNTLNALRKRSDELMYRVKRSGKNGFSI